VEKEEKKEKEEKEKEKEEKQGKYTSKQSPKSMWMIMPELRLSIKLLG